MYLNPFSTEYATVEVNGAPSLAGAVVSVAFIPAGSELSDQTTWLSTTQVGSTNEFRLLLSGSKVTTPPAGSTKLTADKYESWVRVVVGQETVVRRVSSLTVA